MRIRLILLTVILCVLTIFFRASNLAGKLTFEWDQDRDYRAVKSMVQTKKPLLLGPIVRGDSGFYLGPLYYYLITPLYLVSHGNPMALAAISIGADLGVVILVLALYPPLIGVLGSFLVALIWASSPLIINNSYTPWNVSLISVWVVLYLYLLLSLNKNSRYLWLWLTVFLSSLTTNIHISLLPIAFVLITLNLRHFLKRSLREYLGLFAAMIIPVSTLIIHDLRHNWHNLIFIKQFLVGHASEPTSVTLLLHLIAQKFGYTISRLFFGVSNTLTGTMLIVFILVLSLYLAKHLKSYRLIIQYSLIIIATILISLIIYRDHDFAEYYFDATLIPVLLLLGTIVKYFAGKLKIYFTWLVLSILIVSYLYLGNHTRLQDIQPYSLTNKKLIIQTIANLGYPVEVRINLPRERNTGFDYLMHNIGLTSDPRSPRKAYIYEASNHEIIAPEEAKSIILESPISVFNLIVFSN